MPQNLKTTPASEIDELPLLSQEEERLVELLTSGKGNAEAYRLAYGADGYNPNSLAVKACRKIASPKIQRHLRALQAVGLAKLGLTREDRIRDELAFAQRCEDAGNMGAAGQARDRINQLLGLKVDRFADVTESTSDPVAILKDIAASDPKVAEQLAAKARIDWSEINPATRTVN